MPNIRTIRTRTVLCLMLLMVAVHAVARPISEEKACAAATKFYYMKTMGDAIKKVKALTEHFDYSPEMKMVHRWQHTDEQWNRMVADELAAGRPIYYSSRSTKYDGHAFVVCGMDEQGLYYVNWGWGGSCDGYFDFDVVTAADAAYNYVQSAIVGIEPLKQKIE